MWSNYKLAPFIQFSESLNYWERLKDKNNKNQGVQCPLTTHYPGDYLFKMYTMNNLCHFVIQTIEYVIKVIIQM